MFPKNCKLFLTFGILKVFKFNRSSFLSHYILHVSYVHQTKFIDIIHETPMARTFTKKELSKFHKWKLLKLQFEPLPRSVGKHSTHKYRSKIITETLHEYYLKTFSSCWALKAFQRPANSILCKTSKIFPSFINFLKPIVICVACLKVYGNTNYLHTFFQVSYSPGRSEGCFFGEIIFITLSFRSRFSSFPGRVIFKCRDSSASTESFNVFIT